MNRLLAALAALGGGTFSVGAAPLVGQMITLDGTEAWVVAADPANVGKTEKWFAAPRTPRMRTTPPTCWPMWLVWP